MHFKKNRGTLVLLVLIGLVFIVPFIIMIVGSLLKMKIPIGNPFNWLFSADLSGVNFDYIFRNSDYPK